MKETYKRWNEDYLQKGKSVEIFDLFEQLVTSIGVECIFGFEVKDLTIPWAENGKTLTKPIGWAVNSCLNELFARTTKPHFAMMPFLLNTFWSQQDKDLKTNCDSIRQYCRNVIQ
jgi:hypothetical protein